MLQSKIKILMVEDDAVLGQLVQEFLRGQNFDVTLSMNGDEAWRLFMKHNYDICLLDVLIPGRKDGMTLAKNIRKKNKDVPIILVSCKIEDKDKIAGLLTGADDYLAKPYNLKVLLSKINVFLKRMEKEVNPTHELIQIGNFSFDYSKLVLRNESVTHQLTVKEANLVRYLCLNANRLIKREDLLTNIWGKDDYFLGRSMDVFITKIRKYFKEHNEIKLKTIHGIGYRFSYKYVA